MMSDSRQADRRDEIQPVAPLPVTVPELVRLDALALSALIQSRAVACVEVMSTYLDHIDRVNPAVNAIVSRRDRDELLAEARAADAQLDRGESRGWLHGVPQAVKDLAATAGLRTTLGSPLFRDAVPAVDSASVARLRRAGAILIGKTNTPEFGLGSHTFNPVFGTTRNAYDQSRTAGGSSGGAAVALALRLLPVADGSDMGGSLRNPAAYNNVFGFRPSAGVVPTWPAVDLFAPQLGTDGPMGRTVADVARLLATQAGYDPRAPLSLDGDPARFAQPLDRDHAGARLGWLGDFGGYLRTEPGVLALCEASLPVFETLGARVEPARPDFDLARLWQSWLTLRQWVTAGRLGEHYADPARRAQLKPEAQWEVEAGRRLSAGDIAEASAVRSAWYQTLLSMFATYDYLLLPSAQVFPFDADLRWPAKIDGTPMDTYHRWMEVAIYATMAGCPAISLPVGFDARGLPMGMQLIGPPRADLAVLQLAHAYEQATRWVARRPPPMLALG